MLINNLNASKKILADPESPAVPILEDEINTLVYQLFELNPVEIAVIVGRKELKESMRIK
jgi:hypothetical protein